MNPVTVVVSARGHENVKATHKTTFEITKEAVLTKQGECIIAVKATRAPFDLPPEFKHAARREGARITITIEVGELKEVVYAEGTPQLTFTHSTDLVVRKSSHVCSRTLAVRADKAANDFSRKLVAMLKDPNQEVTVTLSVGDY